VIDGGSPYRQRFGDFFGYNKLFPFGSEIVFIPSEVAGDETLQFEAAAQPGIFLGYGVHSGAYLGAHVSEFTAAIYHIGRRKSDNNRYPNGT
jgi:membrane protein YqaA with SNARE-associated domain